MIQKAISNFIKFFILFSILFFTKWNCYAQLRSVNPQVLAFDRICAANNSSEYTATFTYSGFTAETVFWVELSNNDFTTIIVAKTESIRNPGANQKTIVFSIPSNLAGSDTYSLRVSTTGFSSSKFVSFGLKTSFPIYYKSHDKQYTINNFSSTATYCSGGSYLLSIDPDSANSINDSPLKYPFLSYNWYKDNGVSALPTLVAGAAGPSYDVSSPGVYYVETNYGTCSSGSYSNRVTVTSSNSGGASVSINSSLGNPFCLNTDGTILTATSGNKYTWKKDGAPFGGNTRTVKATESGIYTVDVDFVGCKATGSINLISNSFNASIDVADEFQLDDGETLSVSVTTDATSATYEWYFNNNLISGATSGTYLVAAIGTYKVKISQASGCLSSKEFVFRARGKISPSSVIPNIISLSGVSPYWNIPDEYKNANTKVMIISSNGEMVLDVNNYQGDWPQTSIDFKNVNPVYYYVIKSETGQKKGSITVIR